MAKKVCFAGERALFREPIQLLAAKARLPIHDRRLPPVAISLFAQFAPPPLR